MLRNIVIGGVVFLHFPILFGIWGELQIIRSQQNRSNWRIEHYLEELCKLLSNNNRQNNILYDELSNKRRG